ncbi:hypothetical protein QN277_016327 [Acacia crassicarpa]|uniref:RNase H type-1 domain-containing protein n=1 Tax=Acacia crassicarpa TaxID=499986 RepID=A0AAE1MWE9_9FABA|nr:hypothetical protein QN277_016327 [Acacia crassicarpa]
MQESVAVVVFPPIGTEKWVPPDEGWVKINVDGAVSRYESRAGCGGVIRDRSGEWVAGFTHFLGSCSVFQAEEWAILKGLSLAWDLGLRRIILESDAKEVLDMLDDDRMGSRGDLLYWSIKDLMSRGWELKFQFAPRDRNVVADTLAKQGLSSSAFLDTCPDYLRTLVSNEMMGLIPLL